MSSDSSSALASNAKPIDIAILGAAGRMGRALIRSLDEARQNSNLNFNLVAAWVSLDNDCMGLDSGLICSGDVNGIEFNLPHDDLNLDCIIDFSSPETSLETLQLARRCQANLVVGTTGFNAAQLEVFEQASEELAIVLSSNMSIGVNLCFHLIQEAAKAMGPQADIEIVETHHRNKLDAPSGTAIEMGKLIAQTMNLNFEESAIYARHGIGEPREQHKIGFASVRAGDVVGDHTVLFAAEGERIEITHKASDRKIYAQGALRAATWLQGKPKGLYDMRDVLGFS